VRVAGEYLNRYCEHCGKLIPVDKTNGAARHNARRFCDRSCVGGKRKDAIQPIQRDTGDRKPEDWAFWRLVQVKSPKKRTCLRCRREFVSESAGNRHCAECRKAIDRSPRRVFSDELRELTTTNGLRFGGRY
jgi:predicted nucleic acid-binding Zn ribbon protein